MRAKARLHPSDLRSINRLTIDAIVGLTDLVEALHHNIASIPGVFVTRNQGRTSGITGLVYRSIRGATRLAGSGLDVLFALLAPRRGEKGASPERETVVAALNGVLGDYLAARKNSLAITMRLRHGGHPLQLTRGALSAAMPQLGNKLLVLVHGLCMNDLQWNRQGHDHGAALSHDLGYTPSICTTTAVCMSPSTGANLPLCLKRWLRIGRCP